MRLGHNCTLSGSTLCPTFPSFNLSEFGSGLPGRRHSLGKRLSQVPVVMADFLDSFFLIPTGKELINISN
jgi:hypothetical protein